MTQERSWRDVMGSKYFTARNLTEEDDLVVTVSNAEVREIDEGNPRILLHFANWDRPMIMNISNCYYTEWALGTDDYKQWIGREIILYKDTAEYEGESRETVRVRPYNNEADSYNNGSTHADAVAEFEKVGNEIYKQRWADIKRRTVQKYMLVKTNVEGITDPIKLGIPALQELTENMLNQATSPKNGQPETN
ncbi:MAG: hypothetical protein CL666_04645 [Balneola sp.]|nr:hypothetical protein [Balneola sp.]